MKQNFKNNKVEKIDIVENLTKINDKLVKFLKELWNWEIPYYYQKLDDSLNTSNSKLKTNFEKLKINFNNIIKDNNDFKKFKEIHFNSVENIISDLIPEKFFNKYFWEKGFVYWEEDYKYFLNKFEKELFKDNCEIPYKNISNNFDNFLLKLNINNYSKLINLIESNENILSLCNDYWNYWNNKNFSNILNKFERNTYSIPNENDKKSLLRLLDLYWDFSRDWNFTLEWINYWNKRIGLTNLFEKIEPKFNNENKSILLKHPYLIFSYQKNQFLKNINFTKEDILNSLVNIEKNVLANDVFIKNIYENNWNKQEKIFTFLDEKLEELFNWNIKEKIDFKKLHLYLPKDYINNWFINILVNQDFKDSGFKDHLTIKSPLFNYIEDLIRILDSEKDNINKIINDIDFINEFNEIYDKVFLIYIKYLSNIKINDLNKRNIYEGNLFYKDDFRFNKFSFQIEENTYTMSDFINKNIWNIINELEKNTILRDFDKLLIINSLLWNMWKELKEELLYNKILVNFFKKYQKEYFEDLNNPISTIFKFNKNLNRIEVNLNSQNMKQILWDQYEVIEDCEDWIRLKQSNWTFDNNNIIISKLHLWEKYDWFENTYKFTNIWEKFRHINTLYKDYIFNDKLKLIVSLKRPSWLWKYWNYNFFQERIDEKTWKKILLCMLDQSWTSKPTSNTEIERFNLIFDENWNKIK